MTRSKLTKQIASQFPHFTQADIDAAVKAIMSGISSTLEKGGRIEIRGFGHFTARVRPARQTRNPKTGQLLISPAKRYVHFKPGTEMKDRVNASDCDKPSYALTAPHLSIQHALSRKDNQSFGFVTPNGGGTKIKPSKK